MKQRQDVYTRRCLFECMYNDCVQRTANNVYIRIWHTKGLKRKNLVLTNFLSYYNIILLQYVYYNITISSNYVRVIAFACKA